MWSRFVGNYWEFMSLIMLKIKLVECGFASGQMCCIGMWCDARLVFSSDSKLKL